MAMSRKRWARFAFAAAFVGMTAIAACTGIAGVSGFEVDECFDGGCSATEAGNDQQVPDDDAGDASIDVNADACPCPEGTTRLANGICTLPSGANRRFVSCEDPVKMPDDCQSGISIQVCPEDIDSGIKYPQANCDGGQDYFLPSAYVQLGNSHTGKWISDIKGAFGIGSYLSCAQVTGTCLVSPLAVSKGVTNTGASNGQQFALALQPDAGCGIITVITQPYDAGSDGGN